VSLFYDVTVTVADVDISAWVAAGATIDRGRTSTGEGFTAPQAVFDVFTALATPTGMDPDDAPALADGDEVLIHATWDGTTQWRRFTGKIQALDWSPYRYRVTAAGNSVDLAATRVLDTYGVDPTPAIPIPPEQDIPSTGPTLPGRVGRIADELGITINVIGTEGRWLLGIPENTPGMNALDALLDIASDCDGLLRETPLGDIDYVARIHDRAARYTIPATVVEHDTLDFNLERGLIRNSIDVYYGDIDEDTGEQPRAYALNTPSVIELGERPGDPIYTGLRFKVGAQGKGARWLTNHRRAWAASDITLVMALAEEGDEADDILTLAEGDPVRVGPLPDGAPMTYYDADILGFTEILHQEDYRIVLHLSPGSPAAGEDDGNWIVDGSITGGEDTGTYVVDGREWRWHAWYTAGDHDDLVVDASVTGRSLVLGGGGDGGDGHNNGVSAHDGGGGGAGAAYEDDGTYLPVGTHTVHVGAHTAYSQLFNTRAHGGGDGGTAGNGEDGGNGGGGSGVYSGTTLGGDKTGGSLDGGVTTTTTGFACADGGGGTSTGGNGGSAALSSDITGTTVVYGVGGVHGAGTTATPGPGDGGAGGLAGVGNPGEDGQAGAVIIAYRISPGTSGYPYESPLYIYDDPTLTYGG
jgi:hypothetical protein